MMLVVRRLWRRRGVLARRFVRGRKMGEGRRRERRGRLRSLREGKGNDDHVDESNVNEVDECNGEL